MFFYFRRKTKKNTKRTRQFLNAENFEICKREY